MAQSTGLSGSTYGGAINGTAQSNYRTNAALNENSFLSSTGNTLDAYIAQGQAILGNLGDQRDILKGAATLPFDTGFATD